MEMDKFFLVNNKRPRESHLESPEPVTYKSIDDTTSDDPTQTITHDSSIHVFKKIRYSDKEDAQAITDACTSEIATPDQDKQKDAHGQENRVEISSGSEQKAPCRFCRKEISKSNRNRHEISCFKNPKAPRFTCDHCLKSFQRNDNLRTHLKKCCRSPEGLQKKTFLPCNYAECKEKFMTVTLLVSHLQNCHKAPVCDSQSLTFENEKSFFDWKEEEEARTFSYFSKKCGQYASNEEVTKYFYCQQHGSQKAHRKNESLQRKTDRRVAHGRTKTGQVCIASIKAIYLQNGTVNVTYQPTHSHPLNPSSMQFHPLSGTSYKFIDTQIAAGVSPQVVKRELKKRALEKANLLNLDNQENLKDCFVSLKLIRERARRKQNSRMYHADDATSVMLLTQHLMKDDPDLVIIYKPLGMPCTIGPTEINDLPDSKNVFMFGFQTKEQRELMVKGCKMILLVDETHCTNQYGFSLLNMVVVDENKRGWPVGHFISNKGEEQWVQFFFKAVKSKNPDLYINCVITDDDPKLINAMELGFQTELRHILCMWHLSKTFKKQLREKAPKNQVEDMFIGLKLIVDSKSYTDFQKYSAAFLAKYKDSSRFY